MRPVRAAVCRAFGEPLTIEEIDLAAPGPGEIEVALAACAICQSDIHYLEGAGRATSCRLRARGGGSRRGRRCRRRRDSTSGDHVVVTLVRSCGHCVSCSRDEPVLCETTFALDEQKPTDRARRELDRAGTSHGGVRRTGRRRCLSGGRDRRRRPIRPRRPARLRRDHGVRRGGRHRRGRAGSSVVVIGTGGVGLNAVQGAVLAGATTVVARRSLGAEARGGAPSRGDPHDRSRERGRRRDRRVAHIRAEGRLRDRHRRGKRRGRAGAAPPPALGKHGDRRDARLRCDGIDRSRRDRQRRPEDPRQQDGLGAESRSTSPTWSRSTARDA